MELAIARLAGSFLFLRKNMFKRLRLILSVILILLIVYTTILYFIDRSAFQAMRDHDELCTDYLESVDQYWSSDRDDWYKENCELDGSRYSVADSKTTRWKVVGANLDNAIAYIMYVVGGFIMLYVGKWIVAGKEEKY